MRSWSRTTFVRPSPSLPHTDARAAPLDTPRLTRESPRRADFCIWLATWLVTLIIYSSIIGGFYGTSIVSLLLAASGRPAALADLQGPGIEILRGRLA